MILFKTFWKEILLTLLVFGALFAVYERGSTDGYSKAEAKYVKQINEENAKINAKIVTIEANSNLLISEARQANDVLSKDVRQILYGVKGKTLTIIKDGGCTPSQTFSDTINTLNKRVNQNIKDAQK